MKKRRFCISILCFFLFFQYTKIGVAKNEHTPMKCEEKLNLLEPAKPKTIYDYELLPERNISTFKEKVLPISLVQKNGNKVPFAIAYKNLNWQRPAYDPIWHSSLRRWSYVPLNMAYQQHIVYSYQGGLSYWYDLSSYLALPNGTGGPSPINEYAFTIKYPYVVRLVVFNFNITSIKYYKNQIVVSGVPLRKGLTIVDFDTKKFSDSKKLLQLATPDGYELDYLILYLSNH
ncbi:hypothetical protein LL037_12160 [Clostridium estertheticum]|uniref:hypothetical protein n=1 Tax=Clostridium estertheticum TaxID=238834 RepID=UPI001C0E00A1|nr:hypothetical protein [Clostridium estertheticum]MBU3201658.1 hypothetical protein [Clostridium estertheticum]WAG67844.1 hypothetical protein LL037_12160 [Clostridium estertheticum]